MLVDCRSRNGTRKVRFANRDLALGELNYQWTLYRRKMHAYRCPCCGGWHLAKRHSRAA
jgi:hypothetical protein